MTCSCPHSDGRAPVTACASAIFSFDRWRVSWTACLQFFNTHRSGRTSAKTLDLKKKKPFFFDFKKQRDTATRSHCTRPIDVWTSRYRPSSSRSPRQVRPPRVYAGSTHRFVVRTVFGRRSSRTTRKQNIDCSSRDIRSIRRRNC